METVIGLVSGIIGAITGSIATFGIYRYSQYMTSRRKLLDKLVLLRHDIQGDANFSLTDFINTKPETWKESLKDIWTLYNGTIDWALFWKRCKI